MRALSLAIFEAARSITLEEIGAAALPALARAREAGVSGSTRVVELTEGILFMRPVGEPRPRGAR